jgi:hypothetical protein
MKATKTWSVTFEGALDEGARKALEAADDLGGIRADGAGRHRVVATGATAEAAIGRVRKALDGHGSFSGFRAEAAGE